MSTLQLTPAQINASETAVWQEILRQALADLRVSIPAIVKSVDYSKNPPVVSVAIAVSELVRMPSGPRWTAIKPINNVPVVLPSAGGFSLTLPLKAGDEGMLVFCDSCIDLWWQRGGVQPPDGAPLVQPQFERRRHDLTDCGFYPGARSQARPLTTWSQTAARLTSDDGTTYIEVAPSGVINIKAPGGLNINGATAVTGGLSSTGDGVFNGHSASNHVHGGVTSGGSDTGTAIG